MIVVFPNRLVTVFQYQTPNVDNAGRILHDIHVTSDSKLNYFGGNHLVTGDLSVRSDEDQWSIDFANVTSILERDVVEPKAMLGGPLLSEILYGK